MKWNATEHLYKNMQSSVDTLFNTLDASMHLSDYHDYRQFQLTVAAILKD